MSWTHDEQRAVANALLGSWPGTMTQWGKEAFAAYVAELQARGLSPEGVLVAIRTWPSGSDFPPSAPNLAATARKDPGAPTPEEALRLTRWVLAARTPSTKAVWLADERTRADEQAILERATEAHPLVATLVRDHLRRLRGLDLSDNSEEPWDRKQFLALWEHHVAASEGREVAALVAGRRGGMHRLGSPLSVIDGPRRELEAGK